MNSRWSGKVGNVVFRTQEGQVMVSEMPKPSSSPATKTPESEARKAVFSCISRFSKMHEASIYQSFSDIKLGTPRNYFMKVNYKPLYKAFEALTVDATDAEIEKAVTQYATQHPDEIYRVKKAGAQSVYLTGAWDDAANPVNGTVTLGGTKLVAGALAPALSTGQPLSIVGSGLSGMLVIVTATKLGGVTTENQSATALTDLQQNDSSINAKIAAALDGKYLVSIKIDDTVLLSMKNADQGGMG